MKSDDQKAKMNEIVVAAQRIIIHELKPNTEIETGKKLSELFKTNYDFGAYSKELQTNKEALMKMYEDKCIEITEFYISSQKARIEEIKEGLLDIAFQVTLENYSDNIHTIEMILSETLQFTHTKGYFELMKTDVLNYLANKLKEIGISYHYKK